MPAHLIIEPDHGGHTHDGDHDNDGFPVMIQLGLFHLGAIALLWLVSDISCTAAISERMMPGCAIKLVAERINTRAISNTVTTPLPNLGSR